MEELLDLFGDDDHVTTFLQHLCAINMKYNYFCVQHGFFFFLDLSTYDDKCILIGKTLTSFVQVVHNLVTRQKLPFFFQKRQVNIAYFLPIHLNLSSSPN